MALRQTTFQEVFWLCVINVLPKFEMFEAQSDTKKRETHIKYLF